jgi:predicted O-linked N-acetylglucosamine transferase (SPINDLY family)
MDPNAVFGQANSLLQAGRLDEAAALYDQILEAFPEHADTLQLRGVVDLQRGAFDEGLRRFDLAISLQPDHGPAHVNRAAALIGLGRAEEALAAAERALGLVPRSLAAHNNMASALNQLGRSPQALEVCDRAMALGLEDGSLHLHRAAALIYVHRFDDAVAAADRAIEINPDVPDAHGYRAYALTQLHRMVEAAASHERALALAPHSAEGHFSRAVALQYARDHFGAVKSCDQALALRPAYAEALQLRATALNCLERYDDAIADLDRCLELQPDFANAYALRGMCFALSKRPERALADLEIALDLDPTIRVIPGQCAYLGLQVCEWEGLQERIESIHAAIDNKFFAVQPLVLATLPSTPKHQHTIATCAYQDTAPAPFREIRGTRAFNEKLRIAYFSSDFGDHPVGHLIIGLLEEHDRSQFEVISVSFGSDVNDAARRRIERASDRFIEAQGMTDDETAALARDLNVHIAIDLNGYTLNMRPRIFSIGAAPIQVNYLGFPGTLGSDRIHYIIGDRVIIPPEHYPYFSERVVTMPHSYFLTNNIKRQVPARLSTRREVGLPDTGFVFACFNATQKITPDAFDVWMRLLKAVDGSVLWLNECIPTGMRNLRREAKERGVSPDRIIFAPRTPGLEYLTRYRLADLFLDTFYYNAHATGAEALMMGLPVVTRLGAAFAGRVGASLLTAIGLPELIATDSEGYERIALRLAQDPAVYKDVREKLARNLATYPLFDTKRYTRNLEAAYREMWTRHEQGLAPDHIKVLEAGGPAV